MEWRRGDRRGVKSVTQPKNQCHAPGARASKSKQQECEGNEWECKSCHSHGECFLFSPLGCTTYHINISQGMVWVRKAKIFDFWLQKYQTLRVCGLLVVLLCVRNKFVNQLMKVQLIFIKMY